MKRFLYLFAVVVNCLALNGLQAQIRMPAILSDHMVLQANMSVPIWGMAMPNGKVTVSFAGQEASAVVDAQGYWRLGLKPMAASEVGRNMILFETTTSGGKNQVQIEDVVVGQVWLAGGQSNMAFPVSSMEGKESVLQRADNAQLRLFHVTHMTAAEPVGLRPGEVSGDLEGKWVLASEKTVASFSAVAYLFGEELQRALHQPVGMISSNWGGTPIKTWMSQTAFTQNPNLHSYIEEYQKALVVHRKLISDPSSDEAYKAAEKLWQQDVGKNLDAENKAWNEKKLNGVDPGPKPKPSRPEPQNPDPTGVPLGGYRPSTPSISWNAMLAPMVPFAVRGALWYQGEANVSGYREYGEMLRAMVSNWRSLWGEPEMEFLCVQLPMNGPNGGKRELAHLREQQASVLQLPHTALAVAFDVGNPNDVHPASKIDIGHRLALIALGKVYGKQVAYTNPTMQSVNREGGKIRVNFTSVNGKLMIGKAPWLAKGAKAIPTDRLEGFELAGSNQKYYPAEAHIEGNSVIVSAQDVPEPVDIRYAFDASPEANLYDEAGMPAAPFRTDRIDN